MKLNSKKGSWKKQSADFLQSLQKNPSLRLKVIIAAAAAAVLVIGLILWLILIPEKQEVAPAADTASATGTLMQPAGGEPQLKEPQNHNPNPDLQGPAAAETDIPGLQDSQIPLAPEPVSRAPGKSGSKMLFCGSYSSADAAESDKARAAFLGLSSKPALFRDHIVLLFGPYSSRENALETFSKLRQGAVFEQCTLYDI